MTPAAFAPHVQVAHEWRPRSSQRIILAAGNPTQAAVATGDGRVTYLELTEDGIQGKRLCRMAVHSTAR